MQRLIIFLSMTVAGGAGWWLGAKVGFMTGFVCSAVGSVIGVYVGWRFTRDFLG